MTPHRPVNARRKQAKCVVDCSCGWEGRPQSTYGQASEAWLEHYREELGPL